MKKLCTFVLALSAWFLLLGGVAFASIGIQEDGSGEGQAANLNVSTGLNVENDGTTAALTLDQTGDTTIRTTLLATGRVNATLSLASSTTTITGTNVPYSVIRKLVGGASSLDITPGTTLANGKPGQITTFIVSGLMTNGSWTITPTTKTGFVSISMDTKGDTLSLLYVDDTIGWIILANGGCVVTQNT